jgi:hypothetical protein
MSFLRSHHRRTWGRSAVDCPSKSAAADLYTQTVDNQLTRRWPQISWPRYTDSRQWADLYTQVEEMSWPLQQKAGIQLISKLRQRPISWPLHTDNDQSADLFSPWKIGREGEYTRTYSEISRRNGGQILKRKKCERKRFQEESCEKKESKIVTCMQTPRRNTD